MDIVLGGFFNKNCNNLAIHELKEFEKLLDFNDKVLTDYFVMNNPNLDLDSIEIVKKIKNYLEDQ